ncbi:hypothetical protein [Eubacterium aggregans]|uniref:hypothetical protein n=1 Tax=Eubacterium aggregans TaxID=81409 RepID=UPI003F3C80EA
MQKTAFAEAILRRQNWEADGVYRIIGTPLSDEVMEFRFDRAEKIGTYLHRRKRQSTERQEQSGIKELSD